MLLLSVQNINTDFMDIKEVLYFLPVILAKAIPNFLPSTA